MESDPRKLYRFSNRWPTLLFIKCPGPFVKDGPLLFHPLATMLTSNNALFTAHQIKTESSVPYAYLFISHSPTNLGPVWYFCLNNNFQYLNNITHIFIFFHSHVFLKNTNNVIRNLLPNRPSTSYT